jgi:hypothetical protein
MHSTQHRKTCLRIASYAQGDVYMLVMYLINQLAASDVQNTLRAAGHACSARVRCAPFREDVTILKSRML